MSTHKRTPASPPHAVNPAAQLVVHLPAEHSSPAAHTRPHAPQCEGFDVSDAHSRPQRFCPLGQLSAHMPDTHASPEAQRTSHPPQFSRSARVSTQPLVQRVWPDVHVSETPVSITIDASRPEASGRDNIGGEHAPAANDATTSRD